MFDAEKPKIGETPGRTVPETIAPNNEGLEPGFDVAEPPPVPAPTAAAPAAPPSDPKTLPQVLDDAKGKFKIEVDAAAGLLKPAGKKLTELIGKKKDADEKLAKAMEAKRNAEQNPQIAGFPGGGGGSPSSPSSSTGGDHPDGDAKSMDASGTDANTGSLPAPVDDAKIGDSGGLAQADPLNYNTDVIPSSISGTNLNLAPANSSDRYNPGNLAARNFAELSGGKPGQVMRDVASLAASTALIPKSGGAQTPISGKGGDQAKSGDGDGNANMSGIGASTETAGTAKDGNKGTFQEGSNGGEANEVASTTNSSEYSSDPNRARRAPASDAKEEAPSQGIRDFIGKWGSVCKGALGSQIGVCHTVKPTEDIGERILRAEAGA